MDITVRVTDGEVRADDTGGDGTPIVLLHPGVADSTVWDPILPGLAARHRVIRYDARGFGHSPAPTAAYSLADDLRRVLDHFGLDRAVLVGSSMGGATAVSVALAEPERVAALGLLVPGVTGYPGFVEIGEILGKVAELAAGGDVEAVVDLGLRTWGRAGTAPDEEAAAHLRAVLPAWFATLGYQNEDAPAFDRLGELTMPSTLMLGEQDHPEVVRCNEEMAARIPHCRLVRLQHSDHLPTLREPGAVLRAVEELCADVK